MGRAFLSSLVIAGDVRGQDSIEKIFVSIKVNNSDVEETLSKIENLTGFNFTYKKGYLPKDKKLTINSNYISLANLLREVLPFESGLCIKGEIAHIKSIKTNAGNPTWLVARNNDSLVLLTQKK